MDNLDIWRAAKLLVSQHGTFAEDRARNRQFEMLSRGDVVGFAVWGRIREAIGELHRAEKPDGKRVH